MNAQRIRRGTLLFASLLTIPACMTACDSGKKAEGDKAEEKADAAKPDAAEGDEADAAKPEGDKAEGDKAEGDKAEGDKPEEKTEEEKKAERVERIKKEFASLEEWKAKEGERLNDEVVKGIQELVGKDFASPKEAIAAVVASPHRSPDNVKRDQYRHPAETLEFFGVKPDMTVVEVGPGRGWYTEILAPLLAKSGKLVVNSPNPEGAEDDTSRIYGKRIHTFLETSPDAYGKVQVLVPSDKDKFEIGEAGSADMVIVIRGLHGVAGADKLGERLKVMHETLKPGGILAVVQHRAKEGTDYKETAEAGYLPEAWLVEQITAAGFELQEKSEINANPKDTTDHPEGVWTLPPTLALGDTDKAKYEEIGESDRMTLRFVKK